MEISYTKSDSRIASDPIPPALLIYLNGKLVPKEEARVSVFDASFQSGDNVWEGIRVYRGRVFHLESHIRRLYDSAKSLDIRIALAPEEIRQAILETLAANQLYDDAHVRVILSRGERRTSGMNPRFVIGKPTLVIIAEHKPPLFGENAVRLITSSVRRPTPDALNPQIHHGNQLNSILAKIEANRAEADDALMLDSRGFIAETDSANIFLARDGCLLTPEPTACLPGITRGLVLKLARSAEIPVEERNLTLADLYAADEAFLTGTIIEIVPIGELDGRRIGASTPGPITIRVRELFQELTKTEGTPLGTAAEQVANSFDERI